MRGGTNLSLSGESTAGDLHDAAARDLEEARKAAHARYMKFYRSVRSPLCPPEIVSKYAECRGSGGPNGFLYTYGVMNGLNVWLACVLRVRVWCGI